MAKTLVALYDTFTDAERVVHELIDDGFAHSDVHLALDHTKSPIATPSSVARDSAYEGANLIDTLTDLGVPSDDAHAYAEGSVVAAHSWWSRVAMNGLSVAWRSSRRLHPVDIHERTAQWRQEGWTGL